MHERVSGLREEELHFGEELGPVLQRAEITGWDFLISEALESSVFRLPYSRDCGVSGGYTRFFQPFDRKLEALEKTVCVSPKEFPLPPRKVLAAVFQGTKCLVWPAAICTGGPCSECP